MQLIKFGTLKTMRAGTISYGSSTSICSSVSYSHCAEWGHSPELNSEYTFFTKDRIVEALPRDF